MTDLKAAGEALKSAGELAKALGPTDETRKEFAQTFLGSVIGQTVVFTGLLLVYAGAIVGAWKFARDDIEALQAALGPIWFWVVVAAPFAVVLAFSALPTALRSYRERRLKALAIADAGQVKLGYFRLHPYGLADSEAFARPDGAERAILDWMKSADTSLLYLSGASGVGKSSAAGAYVLPKLRAFGWAVVETRLFDDPMRRLRMALLDEDGLFARKPADSVPLRDLLDRAAEGRSRKNLPPLLIVVDQFEEFLILHDHEKRAEFSQLLESLAKDPIEGLRLLLVFRSDYQALIFKLGLPAPQLRVNWWDLAPWSRNEATAFLKGSGRVLSDVALASLFRGLDGIEQTRGMYRPITLNMVGMVIARMGVTLDEDPERLIQTYLGQCLTLGQARDFVRSVLSVMITHAGTKDPRTESEIATLTALEPWQVQSTLRSLEGQGLVRRLEGPTAIWEIAHDFLARSIGQLVGRLRPSLWVRMRWSLGPAAVALWIALIVVAVPFWSEREAERAIVEGGLASISATRDGGRVVSFSTLDDKTFRDRAASLRRISRLILDLSSTEITSLEPLRGMTTLQELRLSSPDNTLFRAGATSVKSVDPLRNLTSLQRLYLSGLRVTSIEALRGLTSLQTLDLSGTQVANVEGLRGLTSLQTLDLSRTQVANVEGLRGLTSLQTLDLSRTQVANLEGLRGLTSLQTLNLPDTQVANLEGLRGLTSLQTLNLSGTQVANLEGLRGLTSLQTLDLSRTQVANLEGLRGLTSLQTLNLPGTQVANLEGLRGLTSLQTLDLSGTQVANVEGLRGLTSLQTLDLSRTQVANLEGLRGLTSLQTLDLSRTQVANLEGLRGLTSLQTLNLPDTQVANLERLRGLTSLQTLNLSGTQVANLEGLRGLTSLQTLDLSRTQVANLEGLRGLTSLQTLNLPDTQVANLEGLRGLTSLQTLNLSGTQVANLEELRGLTSLQALNLPDTQVANLEGLRGLTSLQTLNLSGTQVANLEALRGLTSLTVLMLVNTRVQNLEPLKARGSSLSVLGVTEAVLSTMR